MIPYNVLTLVEFKVMQQICTFNPRGKKYKKGEIWKRRDSETARKRGREIVLETEQQGKKGTAGSFHSVLKMRENTMVLRFQQPTAYKPMSEGSCQTVFHTKYSDPLSHRPAVQCTVLQTVLLWRKLVVPMCKPLYQGGQAEAAAIVHVLSSLQVPIELELSSLYLHLQFLSFCHQICSSDEQLEHLF